MSQADQRGRFVWHELMTPNAQTAADFYSNVLPWTTEASTVPGYTLWMNGPSGVAGLMTQPDAVRESGTPPSWLVYIAAPDVDETTEAAQRLGGKLLKAPTDIPGIGRFAVLSDPQGAAFAVFTPAMAAPAGVKRGPVGRFSWHELATIDPQGALAFYAQLFGWTRGPAHDMGTGGLYQIIEHAGAQIGGLHVLQDPSKPPHWLSYVQVERLEETVGAVRAHGGQVLRGPHVVPGGDRVAHVMDPQGGIIALHEPPRAVAAPPPPRRAATRRRPARRGTPQKSAAKRTPTRAKPVAKGTAKRTPARRGTPQKSAAKRTPTRAKSAAKGTAKRTPARRKSAQKSAAKRTPARAKPSRKPAAKRGAKQVTRRVARPAARRTAKAAVRRAPARKAAAKKRPAGKKGRMATRARPRKAAKRVAARTARRR